MKWLQTCSFFALGFALSATAQGSGQQIQFTQIDYQFPDGTKADSTQAWGINPRGNIVGVYVESNVTHGFLRSGGTYSSIDFPGAKSTFANGIDAQGDIVGAYVDSAGVTHGFVLIGNSYTSIDFPGALSTAALGIGPQGDIVGGYSVTSVFDCCGAGTHGFQLSGCAFTSVDLPAAGVILTYAGGINPQGPLWDLTLTNGSSLLARPGYLHSTAIPGHRHHIYECIGHQRAGRLSGATLIPREVTAV